MEKKLLMSAKNVTKQYPGTLALNDVSVDIYAGEVLGLIGENGAGKSTLMKIMIGAETATKGEITMRGSLILRKHQSRRISWASAWSFRSSR